MISRPALKNLGHFIDHCKMKRPSKRVTLLPDLFIDQIIRIPESTQRFLTSAHEIFERGGGNYTGVKTTLTRGGCAANCAAALSALNVPTSLIAKTSELGRQLYSLTSNQPHFDTTHIKADGKLAITAALETRGEHRTQNLMITDTGSAGSFSQKDLSPSDWRLLKESFLVGIFSWNLNRNGTELVEKVSQFCSENQVKTFVDIGDPNTRLAELPKLINHVIRKGLIDYLSMNENELRTISGALGIRRSNTTLIIELAAEVASQLPVELAIHTSNYAGYVRKGKPQFLPTFDVKPRRSTGAGDAWNAGYIFALIHGADAETRIMAANLVAAANVSQDDSEPLTLEKLSNLAKTTRLKNLSELL